MLKNTNLDQKITTQISTSPYNPIWNMAGSRESARTTSEPPRSYELSASRPCFKAKSQESSYEPGGFRCGSRTCAWTSHVSDWIAGRGTDQRPNLNQIISPQHLYVYVDLRGWEWPPHDRGKEHTSFPPKIAPSRGGFRPSCSPPDASYLSAVHLLSRLAASCNPALCSTHSENE